MKRRERGKWLKDAVRLAFGDRITALLNLQTLAKNAIEMAKELPAECHHLSVYTSGVYSNRVCVCVCVCAGVEWWFKSRGGGSRYYQCD